MASCFSPTASKITSGEFIIQAKNQFDPLQPAMNLQIPSGPEGDGKLRSVRPTRTTDIPRASDDQMKLF